MNPVLHFVRLVCVLAFCLALPFAAAQSPAPLALPDLSTLTFTGPGGAVGTNVVHMVGSDSTGAVYIGGPFTQVNGLTTPAVARLKGDGTLDTAWTSGLASGIATLAYADSGGGVNIAVLDAGAWKAWRWTPTSLTLLYSALPVYSISAMASDAAGMIYLAENADSLAAGFTTSAYVHRFAPDGTRDATFEVTLSGQLPCDTGAELFGVQSHIHALRYQNAKLYIGGDFTSSSATLSGSTLSAPIAGAVRVDLQAQKLDTSWIPLPFRGIPASRAPDIAKATCLPQATQIVYDMAVPGDGFVYLAGSFPGALRRFSDATAVMDGSWMPNTGTPTTFFIPTVGLIALDVERHHLYLGARSLWLFPGAKVDSTWSPTPPNGPLIALAVGPDRFNITGGFTTPHPSLVAYPLAATSIIANYYQSILGRAADPAGVSFWGNTTVSVAALGVSPNEAYIAMAMAFFSSPEFTSITLTDAQFVDKLYLTFFNRPADSGGRDFWMSQIASGLTREMVMFAFMFSPEFDSYMSATLDGPYAMRAEVGVVMDFYRGALGRLPDLSGLGTWVNAFRRAQCSADPFGNSYQAAIGIADAFFNSAEYAQRSRQAPQYVSDLYNAFMRRSADTGGFNFWVGQIGSGTTSRADARLAFISTPEFGARVQAIAAAPCTLPMS